MAPLLTVVASLAAMISVQLGGAVRVPPGERKPPPPGMPPTRELKQPPPGLPPATDRVPPPVPSGAQQAEPLLDAEEETSARTWLQDQILDLQAYLGTTLPFAKYRLEDETGGAVWKLQETYDKSKIVPKMTVTYKGQRTGWKASEHNFDVQVPNTRVGFSVVFRDIKLNAIGVGNHFYKKFAVLPLGETDKNKAIYTVRMDTPHFSTGAKKWKVYRGYCKAILGGIGNNCHGNKNATVHAVREVYCSPSVEVEDDKDLYWEAGAPRHCSWRHPLLTGWKHLPLSASFFEDGPNVVSVEREVIPKDGRISGEFETYLYLTIMTALKQAFLMGGSGN